MQYLKITNWDKWQTYRKDRGQPPWIKIHRRVLRNPEWVSLTDAERGQLVVIWLLAADHDGAIPASPEVTQKLCFMSQPPNYNKFIDLGFIESNGCHDGVKMASTGCQYDAPKAEAEAEADKNRVEVGRVPLKNGKVFKIPEKDIIRWKKSFPHINVIQILNTLIEWNISNPKKRKTDSGIMSHITAWLAKENKETWENMQPKINHTEAAPNYPYITKVVKERGF